MSLVGSEVVFMQNEQAESKNVSDKDTQNQRADLLHGGLVSKTRSYVADKLAHSVCCFLLTPELD